MIFELPSEVVLCAVLTMMQQIGRKHLALADDCTVDWTFQKIYLQFYVKSILAKVETQKFATFTVLDDLMRNQFWRIGKCQKLSYLTFFVSLDFDFGEIVQFIMADINQNPK